MKNKLVNKLTVCFISWKQQTSKYTSSGLDPGWKKSVFYTKTSWVAAEQEQAQKQHTVKKKKSFSHR